MVRPKPPRQHVPTVVANAKKDPMTENEIIIIKIFPDRIGLLTNTIDLT